MTDIQLLDSLSQYYFKFGIFTSEGQKTVDVDILNTDDTTTKVSMKIADIMFFTENGTISIPGQYILDKSLLYINRLLTEELSPLVDKILTGNSSEGEIENTLRRIALNVENYIRNYMQSVIQNNNRLGSIINEGADSNKYIYNLNELSKYLRCTLLKK